MTAFCTIYHNLSTCSDMANVNFEHSYLESLAYCSWLESFSN